MLSSLVLYASFTTLCSAEVYTFPVKSIDLTSALTPSFYVLQTGEQLLPVTDLAPVNGIQMEDGSFAIVGKAVEADGSSVKEGFAIKLTSTGAYTAHWKSGVTGDDASNAVVQLPSGGDLLVRAPLFSILCRWSVERRWP